MVVVATVLAVLELRLALLEPSGLPSFQIHRSFRLARATVRKEGRKRFYLTASEVYLRRGSHDKFVGGISFSLSSKGVHPSYVHPSLQHMHTFER